MDILEHLRDELKHFDFGEKSMFIDIYDSTLTKSERKLKMTQFKSADIGIFVCVGCLQEGWDYLKLDCVVVACNIDALIRIFQMVTRPLRPFDGKLAYICIPIIQEDNCLGPNSSLNKVIIEMSNHDNYIMDKIEISEGTYLGGPSAKQTQVNIHESNLNIENIKYIVLDKHGQRKLFTMKEAISFNIANNIKTISQYKEIATRHLKLPVDPLFSYDNYELNWFDYLGHSRQDFYTLGQYKELTRKCEKENPLFWKQAGLLRGDIAVYLHKIDKKCPPADMLEYAYNCTMPSIINIRKSPLKPAKRW